MKPILFKDSANRANQYAKTASNETGTYCRYFNRCIQMHSKHKTKLNKMHYMLFFINVNGFGGFCWILCRAWLRQMGRPAAYIEVSCSYCARSEPVVSESCSLKSRDTSIYAAGRPICRSHAFTFRLYLQMAVFKTADHFSCQAGIVCDVRYFFRF